MSDAARVLGVSERTVWRRVKRGSLEIDRSVTPHVVNVGDVEDDRATTERDRLAGRVRELEAKIERLVSENDRLSDVLSEVRSERDYLRSAHATSLTTQQRLLEAQTDKPSIIERLLRWTRDRE